MNAAQRIFSEAIGQLEQAGIRSARLDAGLLLAHQQGVSRETVLANINKILTNKDIKEYSALIARRAAHEPVAYITGKKEFWSLDFCVTRDTLIPRPDSETLIEAALATLKQRVQKAPVQGRARPITILDIGTGTGCLLIALLTEVRSAEGVGVDTNERALQVATENAKRLGVSGRAKFLESHWCSAIHGTFDLIVSNPPYIPQNEQLMPDVAGFEPHEALFAGADGLDAYRALAPQITPLLAPGGHVLFEVGEHQGEAVEKLLQAEGLAVETAQNDLAGVKRCVIARAVHCPKN